MDLDDLVMVCKYAFALGFSVTFGMLFCVALMTFIKRVIGAKK